MGFASAVSEAGIDPDRAVVWDVGGGSFQITWKDGDRFLVYQGKCGKVPAKNILLDVQGKDAGTPNPISETEAMAAKKRIQEILGTVPKLKANTVF